MIPLVGPGRSLKWLWSLPYIVVVIYFLQRLWRASPPTIHEASPLLMSMFILLTAIAFVQVFTAPIRPPAPQSLAKQGTDYRADDDEENRKQQRRYWMVFSYTFMLLSLLATLYPFSVGWRANVQYIGNVGDPISVFVGCSSHGAPEILSCGTGSAASEGGSAQTAGAPPGQGQGAPATPQGGQPAPASTAPRGAWVLNIGGRVLNPDSVAGEQPPYEVSGGLLVPLYVIILALMGGSVSLTRRLPEYQVRASPGYVATEDAPALSQHQFREYLVFQIVQFLSAPLIGVVAFYLASPAKTETAVALAFAAGFSSESVLLMLRSVSEKISPVSSEERKFGTITGAVTLKGEPRTPLKLATVELTEHPTIRTTTDESGHYTIQNVPVGEHGVRAFYTEQGTRSEERGTVRIDRDYKVVTKNFDIEPSRGGRTLEVARGTPISPPAVTRRELA